MASPRHAATLCAAALLTPSLAGGEMLLELPQQESPAAWEPVLQSVGLSSGRAEQAPWARLVVGEEACELQVATSWGSLLIEPVPCPASASDREEVASLAAVMLEPMVRGEQTLADLPSPEPTELVELVPGGKLRLSSTASQGDPGRGAGPESAGTGDVPSPRLAALGTGSRDLLGVSAELQRAAQPSVTRGGPDGLQLDDRLSGRQPVTLAPTSDGTQLDSIQCSHTGCAAVVDRYRCGEIDGCSTADKCPETRWQDLDLDGYGSRVCLDLGSTTFGNWVQNVGDCDDRHSSVHPGAEEVVGDGIDNNCDGVTR
jgi:hypothetical protein